MRFQWGALSGAADFTAGAEWIKLKEPAAQYLQLCSFPFGAAIAALLVAAWLGITPLGIADFRHVLDSPLWHLLAVISATIAAHELLHVVCYPKCGLDSGTIIGFWPTRLAFYASYEGKLSRNRYIAVLLAPLFFLSCGLLLFASALPQPSAWLMLVSVLNALMSAVDLLAVALFLQQTPAGATVQYHGWDTYWRSPL